MKTIPERTKQSINRLKEMLIYLNNYYKNLRNFRIVELGSWTGCSMELFAKCFYQVVCVDLWDKNPNNKNDLSHKHDMVEVERIFDERLEKYNNVVKIKADTVEGLKQYPDNYFDFSYVDADHSYEGAKRDLIICTKKSKVIMGHDYYGKFPGVMKAVKETLGQPFKVFKDGSWIYKLKDLR